MRIKDNSKKTAIFEAAIDLITRYGLSEVSVAQIAEAADISASTIYIYFRNKEDMLNRLFLWIKEESGKRLIEGLKTNIPVKDGIELVFRNLVRYILDNPVQFAFSEQFSNSPLINKISRDEGQTYYQPLYDLLKNGVEAGILKNVPLKLLSASLLGPVLMMMKDYLSSRVPVTEELISDSFRIIWDGLSV